MLFKDIIMNDFGNVFNMYPYTVLSNYIYNDIFNNHNIFIYCMFNKYNFIIDIINQSMTNIHKYYITAHNTHPSIHPIPTPINNNNITYTRMPDISSLRGPMGQIIIVVDFRPIYRLKQSSSFIHWLWKLLDHDVLEFSIF